MAREALAVRTAVVRSEVEEREHEERVLWYA